MRYAWLAAVLLVFACGDDESTSSTSSSGGGSGAASSSTGAQSCTATFRTLQKDAYRESAGRSSSLWPPHTTTTLTVTCDGETVVDTFRANHGTEPSDTDAMGEVILVEVGSVTVDGTRDELDALASAYDSCECGTEFLSLDALGDAAVQQLVAEVTDYITTHLTCTGSVDAAGLATLLQNGDIDAVIAELPNCSWASGHDWSSGFDEALAAIIAAAQETLADYHVCNNDALLQAALIDGFATAGAVDSCDPGSAACAGPLWFYEP